MTRPRRSLIERLSEPAPQRPLWQRVALPAAGLVCLVVGIIGWLLPVVPGAPLAVLGIPLLFCFSRRAEQRARDVCVRLLRAVTARFAAWRARRRSRRGV